MKPIILNLIIFFLNCYAFASVISTSGNIQFDTSNDGSIEMNLSAHGLSIAKPIASANLDVSGNGIVSDTLTVGTSNTGSSNLYVSGTFGYGFQTVSDNATLGNSSIVFADSSSDNITLTLPYAGNVRGRIYTIKKRSDSNNIWIVGGGNFIDNLSTAELSNTTGGQSYLKVMSDGSQWYSLGQSNDVGEVAASHLKGWWTLGQTSGTSVSDSSGQGNHGTLSGTTFSGCTVTGKIGSALSFDGSNDYVDLPDTPIQGTQWTISLWAKTPTSFSGDPINRFAFGSNHSGEKRSYLGHDATGDLHARIGDAADFGTFQLVVSTWYHLVLRLDGGNGEVFVDTLSKGTANGITYNGSLNLSIGCYNDGAGSHWLGTIDDVRIYNKALNDGEIRTIYEQGQ